MSEDRVLALEGIHNFRDYGGYPVVGGGRLKRGLLWRSGQHHDATDSDLARIAALNLASVFDLRSSREREVHPCRRPEGFLAEVVFGGDPPPRQTAGGETGHSAPHVAAAQAPRQRDVASTREGLRKNYGMIAFRPELVATIRLMLATLAEGRGASLVNCMAGKDRTGIAVAAVHLAAGVHRDDIVADYLLTNTAGDVEARIAAGAATITAMTGQLDDDVLRVLMGVEAEYIEGAFAMMAERHGSTDGYLVEVLGVDAALKERLRAALVEG
ncbi:tyrosine-protein phosphatase [Novosphingobium sp. JCM 18896]|uniref:tyrosine-protein phosphatase n=1 Tax=Novosphingobium sp. JCM 18896 TaxID=2989731 RepID=UPI002221E78E|nr:tyrosine-protein phosphatase [Novosphingobium sp. JCM 18896]MCW1428138.1 tyrosine-protein phosphatase [Novosphingobium sp. JCM 18896]